MNSAQVDQHGISIDSSLSPAMYHLGSFGQNLSIFLCGVAGGRRYTSYHTRHVGRGDRCCQHAPSTHLLGVGRTQHQHSGGHAIYNMYPIAHSMPHQRVTEAPSRLFLPPLVAIFTTYSPAPIPVSLLPVTPGIPLIFRR